MRVRRRADKDTEAKADGDGWGACGAESMDVRGEASDLEGGGEDRDRRPDRRKNKERKEEKNKKEKK